MLTIPDGYKDLLEWDTKSFAHIATIGPDGEPQNTPVWFEWDGEHILVSQTKTRQKYKNVQAEPRVALSILDPNNAYRYLELRGRLVRIDEDPEKAFINRMASKYIGQDVYPWSQPADERVVLVIDPEHTTQMG